MEYNESEIKGVRILGIMLVFASAIMFFVGFSLAISDNARKDDRIYTTATIISVMDLDGFGPGYSISHRKKVWVKHTTKYGHIIIGSLANGDYNYEVGEEIEVYYFADDKEKLYVDDYDMELMLMQICVANSIVGLIIALDKKLQSKIFNILKKLPADKRYERRKSSQNKQLPM